MNTNIENKDKKRINYSLEDELQTVVGAVEILTPKQISKELLNCFCNFVGHKNQALDEVKQELISRNIDEEVIKYIEEKVDNIIFSKYEIEDDYYDDEEY